MQPETISGTAAAKLARAANRPDLADSFESHGPFRVETIQRDKRDITPLSLRPSTREYEIERWQPGDLTLWLYRETTVDWGGGDADVWEDLILTEYPLDNEQVRAAVLAVCDPECVTPLLFSHSWSSTSTQTRLRLGLPGIDDARELAEMRESLAAGLRAWTDAVTALRALDPRPVPPPVVGGQAH